MLNEEIEIQKEAEKAEETNIKLNESIEKIEEEQDIVFKNKVSKITGDLIEKFKHLDITTDKRGIERLKAEMITHVFDSFLENKQELLKKIANKLAFVKDLDEYDDPYEVDVDQSFPHTKTRKNSKANFISRTSRVSRNAPKHNHIAENDIDMEDDIKSLDDPIDVNNEKHLRRNENDFTPVILDQSENNSEEQNNFKDKTNSRRKNKSKRRGSKFAFINEITNKDSEFQK